MNRPDRATVEAIRKTLRDHPGANVCTKRGNDGRTEHSIVPGTRSRRDDSLTALKRRADLAYLKHTADLMFDLASRDRPL